METLLLLLFRRSFSYNDPLAFAPLAFSAEMPPSVQPLTVPLRTQRLCWTAGTVMPATVPEPPPIRAKPLRSIVTLSAETVMPAPPPEAVKFLVK